MKSSIENYYNYLNVTDNLSADNLILLAEGKIMGIHVKNFYPKNILDEATKKVNQNKINYYLNAPDIGRIGMAFYETEMNASLLNNYYKSAKENLLIARQIFSPYLSPIDKLRLDLEEMWTPGANIENIHDQKMFVGLFRKIQPGVSMLPHQDDIRVDSNYNPITLEIKGQIAANIYLQMPAIGKGGNLELWDFSLTDNKFNEMRGSNYGISRDKLPPPTQIISPEVGDLVLFNARRLHAVRECDTSERLSVSCFIGYRSRNKPLTYWS